MRKIELFNKNWIFKMPNKEPIQLDLPHSWNGIDGQDGGNDYLRTTCIYEKEFKTPIVEEGGVTLLQFNGVNSECKVFVNKKIAGEHLGGYSTFIVDITNFLEADNNILEIHVSNEKNDYVYPQRADFTFYGGIYRDVYLIVLPKNRFNFGPYSSPPLRLTPKVSNNNGILLCETYHSGSGDVKISILKDNKIVAEGKPDQDILIPNVRLWDGIKDPFLYTVKADLIIDNKIVDTVIEKTGFRTFHIDPNKGFYLNGKHYPLRGVARHQDRPGVGNAITKKHQDEDMDLIMEIGASTVRLSHYQHDQYFYNLCDEKGQIVWAEIPYISEYLPNGDDNTYSQMRELIRQNYNHPSIICWGISNEIMIKPYKGTILKKIVKNHEKLNEIAKEEDNTRKTVVAAYAVTGSNHPTVKITDLVSWNLYYGWYVPNFLFFHLGMRLNRFRRKYKNIPLGLSEYGAEGMPNLHAAKPKRLDNTEDYQTLYHEKTMKWINKNQWLWATHVWNMFDFGSDGRNQGGEPGMNHKGLVTFDRKIKKDAFYLYKALWSDLIVTSKEKFIHIVGKRYKNRVGKNLKIKVYSNCERLELFRNNQLIEIKSSNKIFNFVLPNFNKTEKIVIKQPNSNIKDEAEFTRVFKPDPSYKLSPHKKGNNMSWEK